MSNPSMTEHLARRAVERSVAGRRAEYEHEMARIAESTFADRAHGDPRPVDA
jgi:hypothetical protein